MWVIDRLSWFLKTQHMAGSASKEPDEQAWEPEFESLESRYKSWVWWCILVIPVQRRWNRLLSSRDIPMFVSSVLALQACTTTPGFFGWEMGSNSGSMPVWQALNQLSSLPSPASLLLRHTLVTIHEACLAFKYKTTEKKSYLMCLVTILTDPVWP